MAKCAETMNMLEGSLWDRILWFALPLAASSILQQLFNSADMVVVGRLTGSAALAAVGSCTPVVSMFVNMVTGLAVGSNVTISYFIGKRNHDSERKAIHTSVLFAILYGLIVLILGQFIASPLLSLLGTSELVMEEAVLYLRIYFLGAPGALLYNYETAILRSRGDTKRPLLCLAASGVSNVLFNLFFVVVCHLGVAGVATATAVSLYISALLLLWLLTHEDTKTRLLVRELRIDSEILKRILIVGIPAALQSMVFNVANLVIQFGVNSLGPVMVAANTVSVNYDTYAYSIVTAFGQACVTFNSQNFGAARYQRCISATRWCWLLGFLCTAAVAVFFHVLAEPLSGIFTTDAEVICYAVRRTRYVLFFQTFSQIVEVSCGAMRGIGHSLQPMLICLAGICGVRILWIVTVFRHMHTFESLVLAFPVSWVVTAVAATVFYLRLRRKVFLEVQD